MVDRPEGTKPYSDPRDSDRETQDQHHHELLDYVVRHDPNAIAVYDNDLRYIYVSERYLNDYDVQDRNVIGRHLYEVFPEMPQKWKDVHVRVLKGAIESSDEDWFERPDGTITWARWECRPWYQPDASIGGLITYTEVITERKLAELARQASEEQKRLIIETVPDLIWLKCVEGKYLACNKIFERFFGATEDGIIGKTDYDFVDKELANSFRKHDKAAMDADQPLRNEEWITFADDGHSALLETTKTPLKDGAGKVIGVLGIGRDITERKRAEDALRESEEKYRRLFETMLNGFVLHEIILDDDGKPCDYRFLDINPAFEKLTGLTTDVIGKRVREVIPNIDKEWIEKFGNVALTGESIAFESYFEPLGKHFEACAYSPKKGQFANIFSDITERVRADETSRKNEALLTEMGRAARIGGWEHDLRTREASWTPETFRIMDIPEGGQPPGPDEHLDFYHPEDRPILEDAYRRAVEEGRPFDLELRCFTATDEPFWCRAIGQPIIEDGQCIKVFGAFQDISERKAWENQLAQAQKMEAVGQLTGGLAHDLNNVLAIISMNFTMLVRKVEDVPDTAKHVDHIRRSIDRAAGLLRKLLDYSRTEAQVERRVSVNGFVREIESLLAKSLTPAIALKLELSDNAWTVEIDPEDFEAALINLALNARDAMPEGGALVIETTNRVIDQEYVDANPGSSAGEFVTISVSDTGTGMTSDVLAKATDPFFTTKDVGAGTGLGLSMVYSFVRRSGGHLKIYSESGSGTVVHMYLPRVQESLQAPEIQTPESEIIRGHGEKVLIVDDEPDLLEIAVTILESLGYRAVAATNGQDALAILKQDSSVDLLFTDVIMPQGMDGYRLAMAAREHRPDLKVLLTSGFTRKREEFVNGDKVVAGDLAKSLLQKPYGPTELAVAVRKALETKVSTSETEK